jgi:uncharacterized Fe-S cluster-containing radical SAM superfamily protein
MQSKNKTPNKKYHNFLNTNIKPYDPIALSKAIEKATCKGEKRKYLKFGTTPNYGKAIGTGYVFGCNLRCVFCWAHDSRDNPQKKGEFLSPKEAFSKIYRIVTKKGLDQVRISDGEPTIGKQHLLGLLESVERSDINRYILESNGILLGHDTDYVKQLSQFKKLHVRISLKAGTPEDFSIKTGAIPEAFELPFIAIRKLREHRIKFGVASMSADPRFMVPEERILLIAKLANIDPALALNLEEEMTVLYPTAIKRLKSAGWISDDSYMPALLKIMPGLRPYIQISYPPIRCMKYPKISRKFTLKAIRELKHGI